MGLTSRGRAGRRGRPQGGARRVRRWWSAMLAVLVVLGIAASAAPILAEGQAPPPVTMQVKAGYDGQIRFGEWMPLSIDVSNSGPDVTGRIKVQAYWDQGPQSPVTEYVRDVALPRGAKKHVTMYVPGSRDRVTVTLVGPGEKVLAEESPVLTPVMGALAAVLSDSPDTARFLSGVNLGVANRPYPLTVVRLAPEEVPDVSAAMGSLNVLVLSDTAPEKLGPEQWRAIEAWVSQGGVLVLGGGSQARRVLDAAPASLRPVKVTGTATITAAPTLKGLLPAGSAAGAVPNGRYVVSAGELAKGTALAGEAGVPLLAEYHHGRGTVYYSAFDLSGEPMSAWAGSPGLWETLLRRAGLGMANVPWGGKWGGGPGYPGPGYPGRFGTQLNWVVRNMPSLEVPSLRILGLLLLGYALLVGPLLYFLLKKLDRRDWAWVIVPTVAIVAAGSVYGIGFAGKGKDVFTNTLAVLRLEPGQRTTPVQSWVGVFAPSRSQFSIGVPGHTLISPSADPGYYGPMPVASGTGRPIGTRVVEGAENRVELLDWNVWTVRTYAVDTDVVVEGSVKGQLTARVENPTYGIPKYVLEGKVTNGLPFDLEDVTVVAGSAFQPLGELPAGKSVDVTISTVVNSGQQPFGPPVFYQIYNPGGGPNFDQEKNRRMQILDAAFSQDGGALPHPITLVGWTKTRAADVGLGSRPGRDHALTLVVAPLELAQKPGRIVLPPGLVQGRLTEADNVRGGPAGPGRYFLEAGSLTFEIEPNLGPGTQVSNLAVALSTNGSLPKVELWNWQTNAWVEAKQAGSSDRWAPEGPTAQFLRDGNGMVRVRVTGSGQPGDFSAPSLVLEGKVAGR